MADDHPQLSARALCALEDVKAYIPSLRAGSVDPNPVLTRLINAATDAIYLYTGREFKPIEETQPAKRTFPIDREVCVERELRVGDLAELDAVTLRSRDGTFTQALDLSYVLEDPMVRQPWQPIGYLEFLRGGSSPALLRYGDVADVEGTWGFPVVPYDVEQACIVTVSIWFARDVSKFSETFSIAEQRVERPRNLPSQVRDDLRQYRVPGV